MALILLNVFIAILEGYFRQIAPKGDKEQIGFLELLKFFVQSEFERISELKKGKQLERAQTKMEKTAVNLVSNETIPQEAKSPKKRIEQDEVDQQAQSEPNSSPGVLVKQKIQIESIEDVVEETPLSNEKSPKKNPKKKNKCQRLIENINNKLEYIWFAIIDFIYQKIIKKFVFTDQQVENEGQGDNPQLAMKVEFQEKRNDAEEDIVLKDIEFYLGRNDEDIFSPIEKENAGNYTFLHGCVLNIEIESKKTEDELQQKKREEDEEKELTNKWISSLEETLLKLSGGKINIIRMGTNTKVLIYCFLRDLTL